MLASMMISIVYTTPVHGILLIWPSAFAKEQGSFTIAGKLADGTWYSFVVSSRRETVE